MDRKQLVSLIDRDEGPKLDFKRKPWDLGTTEGKGEFIKDLLAMANAPGSIGHLILGVGDEADRPLFSIRDQGLSEERLQQVAKEYVEPPIEFTYEETNLHGNTIGLVTIPPSKARPHWAKKPVAHVRDWTFYTRRGSTTDFATLGELEQMIRDRPTNAGLPNDGWTVELLWSRKEHIRLVPCIFLEKWDKEHIDVMTTEELCETIKIRTGKEFTLQGAGNLVGAFNQRADRRRLPHLFVQVDNGSWRFSKKYLDLFREHCTTIHDA